MSTSRAIDGPYVYAPLACSAFVYLGPGLHYVAFDGFRSAQVARDAATFGVPLGAVGVLLAAIWLLRTFRNRGPEHQGTSAARWGLYLSLLGGAMWGTVLLEHAAMGQSSTAGDKANLPPLELVDHGFSRGQHTFEVVHANKLVVINLSTLRAHGFTVEDVRGMIDRSLISINTPDMRGVYALANDMGAIMLGIRDGYPVYLGDVADIRSF